MRRLALLLATTSLVLATTGVAIADEVGDDLAPGDASAAEPESDGAAEPAGEADAFAVLVYTRTTDFRHLSIPDGIAAVQELGEEHGFEVEATEDPAAFTDENLARFAAVIFLNTTGTVVEPDGKEAFERYIRSGGGWVGVHSAADTEYDWDFYGRLLGGAYFHSHPPQQPGIILNEDPDHPSTAHLDEEWLLPLEEYYSFQTNPRDDVHVLLSIDEDSYLQDPNTTHIPRSPELPEGESGVMGDHPMAWCQQIGAGHAWYTAFGHEGYLYRTDDYRQHLLGGILTAAGELDADCSPQAGGAADQTRGVDEPGEPESEASDSGTDRRAGDGDVTAGPGGSTGHGAGPALPATGAGTLAAGTAVLALAFALGSFRPARRRLG